MTKTIARPEIRVALFLAVLLQGCLQPGLMGSDLVARGVDSMGTDRGGDWDLTTAFPGAGHYSGIQPAITNAQVCSSVLFLGASGTAVCLDPATATTDATLAPQLASGTVLYDSSGRKVTGSQATRTLSAANDTVSAGTYAATTLSTVDADLVTGNIKSGITIFGVSGTSSVVDTASGDATAAQILSGKKAYVNGSLVTGTATAGAAVTTWTNGSATTTVTGAIPDGHYSGSLSCAFTSTALTAGNICTSNSIFGVSGSATCQGGYSGGSTIATAAKVCSGSYAYNGSGVAIDGSASCATGTGIDSLVTSNIRHDGDIAAANVVKMGSEGSITTANATYRLIPKIAKDDETTGTAKVIRGTAVWSAGVARKVCGKGIAAIAAKIQDCSDQHTDKPAWNAGVSGRISWDGTVKGTAGQGSWTLVSVYSASLANAAVCDATCYEVWRDDITNLLWSDTLGGGNWCKATGSSNSAFATLPAALKEDDPSNLCDIQAHQEQTNAPESRCTEGTGLNTPAAYDPQKAGMRAGTVSWRLPSRYDFAQADNDGLRWVLPNVAQNFWTTEVLSAYRPYAWSYEGLTGTLAYNAREGTTYHIRCVGR